MRQRHRRHERTPPDCLRAPDFNITRKGVPVGHVETKDVGVNLDEMERGKGPNGEQFKRYSTLPNWILTDYLEFRWYAAGQKRLTVRVADFDGKGRVRATPDGVIVGSAIVRKVSEIRWGEQENLYEGLGDFLLKHKEAVR